MAYSAVFSAPKGVSTLSSSCRSMARCHPPRHLLALPRSRYTSSAAPNERPIEQSVKSVAVLGGGITGLSTAWYLATLAPSIPVTIYERSPRLGGWLHSKTAKFGGGSVLFEQGPRTLRPFSVTGAVTLDLIRQLNLEEELSIIPKTSPAAKNRFIYYPDHLNRLPNSFVSALNAVVLGSVPAMRGSFTGLLFESFRRPRGKDVTDETVGSFITRRFGHEIAQNMVSAVLHGIYAGDVDQLSARSLFPSLWRDEKKYGSITAGMLAQLFSKLQLKEDLDLLEELPKMPVSMASKLENASVYSFKGGIETLSKALVRGLEEHPNVTIKEEINIGSIKHRPTNDNLNIELDTSAGTELHSHVVSTLYAKTTNNLLPSSERVQSLAEIPAVTVMVVNLYFASPRLHGVSGFGYLIPKSVSPTQNPERALGVIFDSDAVPDVTSPGTKLTVMMGGHWWTGRTIYPSEQEAVEMARTVVKRHLGITEVPLATNVALQENCIPQYTVGHHDRCRDAHRALEERYNGRFSVAGSSYRGVGLNDCVRMARDVARGVLYKPGYTGLESFSHEPEWVKT